MLKTLLLSGTGANDSCVPFLVALQQLEELHLAHCKLSDYGVQTIWKMTKLKGVSFANCRIDDKTLEGFSYCSALGSLDVSETQVSDKGVELIVSEVLRSGQQLFSLVLRSCRITDKALVRLSSLSSLTLIDLYGTEVTAQGAAFLKRALPGCMIFVGRNKGGGPKLWQVDQT